MAAKFSKCPRCNKIFAMQPGKTLCARCNTEFLEYEDRVLEAIEKHNLRKPEHIAEFTGYPLDKVIALIENSSLLRHETVDERLCVSCKERPAQKHSEYCFHCRLTLNKAFGDSVKLMAEIYEREERLKLSRGLKANLVQGGGDAAARKHTKRTLRRPDPTPKSRYSS